jgi:hypothetical protein
MCMAWATNACWQASVLNSSWSSNLLLQIWTYDRANNKLRPEDVKLGNLQRQFRSLLIDKQDKFAYAGSTTGDVMQVCRML